MTSPRAGVESATAPASPPRRSGDCFRYASLAMAASLVLTLAATGAAAGASAARPGGGPTPGVSDTATVIRDVRVFDGRETRASADVLLRGDTIAAVGPDLEVPAGARTVDGSGHTLLPGLVDAHTHTFEPSMLRAALAFGVTTELDMFTEPGLARQWREEQRAGEAAGRADIFSAGVLATAPGGHGTQFGLQIPTVEGPGDAEAFVEARIEEGSDYIKIVYDDGGLYGLDLSTISESTLDALVREAHEHDRMAVVHVSTLDAARDAVDAGADGLAHVWADSVPGSGFVEELARRDVFVIPTLAVTRSSAGGAAGEELLEDDRLAPYLSPAQERRLEEGFDSRPGSRASFEAARASVEALHRAGVPILAGTDAPNPGTAHGVSLHGELELLVEAGLTPTEALRAATARPARIFGLEDRGRIGTGLRADLLLVEGDPTERITRTRDITAVWKAGRRLDREGYREELAESAGGAAPGEIDPAEAPMISDFDDGEISAAFGAGWQQTSDAMMGGSSSARLSVVEGGAAGTSHALRVRGEIAEGMQFAWGGAMYVPGSDMRSPADLSAAGGFRFRARGDGGSYRVMLFTESGGRRPLTKSFTAGEEWEAHTFRWEDFQGSDGSGVAAIAVVGGPEPGAYELRIDQLELVE